MADPGPDTAPDVYILILNYKQWDITWECLHSVLQSTYTHYTVCVIDNDSGNRSLEQLAAKLDAQAAAGGQAIDYAFYSGNLDRAQNPFREKVVWVQSPENNGFAAGNNLVLHILRERDAYIWLLNPDMTVRPDTLERLVGYAARQPVAAIIGAQVRMLHEDNSLFCYGGARLNFFSGRPQMILREEDAGKMDFIYGGCLFTHAGNFCSLGLFPEEYFLYWEETDWCYTAKLKGHPLLVCPDAVCFDKISTSIGKGYLSDYYYARNGLYFIAKFRRSGLPVVLFFMGIRWLKRLLMGRWSRAKGMLYGTLDFLKGKKYKGH